MTDELWTHLPDGFHYVPMHEYLGWRRVSASTLKECRSDRSDAWVHDCLVGHNGSDDTAARVLGEVTHTAVFEPDLLEESYIIEPDADPDFFTTDDGKPSTNPRSTKKWKEMRRALEQTGKRIVTAEQYRNALAMRDAVHHHKRASQLLEPAAGPVEVSVAATAEIDEALIPVKVRPDKLHERLGINVQFKTTRNAHPESFIWDCWKFGHYLGADLYGRALSAIGWDYRKTVFVVAQTDGFPEVATYEPDTGMLDAAEQVVTHRLRRIARCMKSGVWRGLSDDIETISLPHPAWDRISEELQLPLLTWEMPVSSDASRQSVSS